MKIALIILALLVLAWFGWQHQEQAKRMVKPYLPQNSGEVEYAKCTTADGTVIYGSSTVNDFVLQNDMFRTYVDSYIRGAKMVAVNEHSDGVVETVMELKLEPRFRACVSRAADHTELEFERHGSERRYFDFISSKASNLSAAPSFSLAPSRPLEGTELGL